MELASPSTAGRTVVVRLDDALPAHGLAELRVRLAEVLGAGDARLVVDVSRVQRMSSAVVAALLWSTRQGRARGVEVSVSGVDGPRHGLLERTGLGTVLVVERSGGR